MRDSQIRAFLNVAETNSLKKTAEELGISQAAVSERIQRLEVSLGKEIDGPKREDGTETRTRLFRNAGHRVELTEHGAIFLPFARMINENWLRAKMNVDHNRLISSSIGIGVQFTLWNPLVPDLLKYMQAEPGLLSPRFSAGKTEVIMDGLRQGQSEIVVAYQPSTDTNMNAEYIFDEHFIMASTDPETVLENIGREYVFVDWGAQFYEEYWKAYEDYKSIREPFAIFERTGLAMNVVRKNGGCGYFPYRFIMDDINDGRMFPVRESAVFQRTVKVVWRNDYSDMIRNTDVKQRERRANDRLCSGSGGVFSEGNVDRIVNHVREIGVQQREKIKEIERLVEEYELKTFNFRL